MITFKTTPKFFFFDRKIILKYMDAKTARALSRALSHIWTTARTSMRYRKLGRVSPPGSPPFAHKETGALLRKLLYFAYAPREKRGVVGPVAHRRGEAPRLNEFGGQVTRRSRRGVVHTSTYPARPFMAPALAKELPQLPARWSSSVQT